MALSILLTAIIFFLFTALVAFCGYMTRKFGYWASRGVREFTSRPWPVFGNVGECCLFLKSAGRTVEEMYVDGEGLKYVGFYLFDQPALLLRDTELIKKVLIKDFDHFHNRFAATSKKDTLGGANMFLLKNPHWKTIRTRLSPVFTSGKLKHMFELMKAVGKDLDDHLESLGLDGEGKILDPKDLSTKFIADALGSCAFGVNANSFNNPAAELRKSGKDMFNFTFWRSLEFKTLFFLPSVVGALGFKFFATTTEKILRHAVGDIMLERMENGPRRSDLIDDLIDLKKEHEQTKTEDPEEFVFDGDNLVAQAAVFFAAGFETSSSTMAFAMYELALNPHVQTRLRKEIMSAMDENNGELTYEMVMQLPYLDMVVSETLRKYPTLPVLERKAEIDYKVPDTDLVIEKGTPVYVSLYGLHYDPKYYPNPEKFDPEHFNEKNKRLRPSEAYLPFGDGPRHCIGMRLGLLKTKFGLVKIILNHELTACSETMTPMRLSSIAVFTVPKRPLYLNFRKIKQHV